MSREIWRTIEGFDNYSVSDRGRVKNNKTKRFRKVSAGIDGYCQIQLSQNGQSKKFLVHRLVAQAFIPNPHNKPQVNHIDCNKSNNRVRNLEWCTVSENMIHAYKNECYIKSKKNILTTLQVRAMRSLYDTCEFTPSEIAEIFEKPPCEIYKILKRISWAHI